MTEENPGEWFDRLYVAATKGQAEIPWERPGPNFLLDEWTSSKAIDGNGLKALVVGAGLGQDAELLASLGFDTVAFDYSETAVGMARARHPDSPVSYTVADLLDPPDEWRQGFDLVFEGYTVQSLPPAYHPAASANVASFVAPGGTLLVVAGTRQPDQHVDGPPWPLTPSELEAFATGGLRTVRVDTVPVTGLRWAETARLELRRS